MSDQPSAPPQEFGLLGVPSPLLEVLDHAGVRTPFEIQRLAIPDALSGRDVLGRAPTGSGKTLAFGLPVLIRLPRATPRRPTGLVLTPTRELAQQIRRELEPYAGAVDRKVGALYGGVDYSRQAERLARGVDLVIATPGRLLDLLDHGDVELSQVSFAVVDEADRMADMGFLPDVRRILELTDPDRQTMLFSATLGEDIQTLIDAYQRDPIRHQVGGIEPDLAHVQHRFLGTHKMGKIDLAAELVAEVGPTMIFCRTRHGVDRVARQLNEAGVTAGWIHGGRSQIQRDAALHAFTTGRVRALVATDVAARGIHVDGVACVLHFDPPEDVTTYLHRSGRTARAGATGVVVSFVNADQVKDTRRLQRELGLPEDITQPRTISQPRTEAVEAQAAPIPGSPRTPTSVPASAGTPKRAKPGKKQRARAKWPKLI